MARRRDPRRFGPGPFLLGLRRDEEIWGEGFPFDVPVIDQAEQLDLSTSITLLAGDNGTGKSTLVESVAAAIGFAEEGGELERSGELPAVPRPALGGALHPVLARTKPRTGTIWNRSGCCAGSSTPPSASCARRSRTRRLRGARAARG